MEVRNISQYFVMKSGLSVPTATVDSQIWDKNASATYIEDGGVMVTDRFGKRLTSASTSDHFVIRYRKDNVIHSTPEIKAKDVKLYKVSTFRPNLEQRSYVGYNGTDDTFTVASKVLSDTAYGVTVLREDDPFYMGIERPQTSFYITGTNPLYVGATPTEWEIVNGLADVIYKDFIRTTTGANVNAVPIKIERVGDFANGTATALTQNLTVYKDSNWATAAAAVTYARGTILVIANKMYVVAETVTAGTAVKLDIAYQGESATITAGTSATTVYSYVPNASDKWGLSITGKARQFEVGLWNYRKVRFKVQVDSEHVTGSIRNYAVNETSAVETKGLTTTSTNVVAKNVNINFGAYLGVGEYPEVAEKESASLGFMGLSKQYLIDKVRHLNRTLYASSACVYSILSISWEHQDTNATTDTINDKGNVFIAIPVAYNTTTAAITAETVASAATYGLAIVLDKLIVTDAGIGTAQTSAIDTY